MREAKLVSVILVVSLLLFGCGAQAQTNTTANGSTGGSTAPPGGAPPAPQPPPQAPPAAQPPPSGGTMNGSSGGSGGSASGSGNGYSGMEFGALVALGVPLECDVTTTTNGTTSTSKIFMKGKDQLRIESSTNNPAGCATMVILPKDKKMYMGCKEGPLMAQCDWLVFQLTGNGTMTGQVSTTGGTNVDTDFSGVSPSQIDCKAWIYDDSMFEADGEICDMSSMGG